MCRNSRIEHIVVVLAIKYYEEKCDYVSEIT